jgi:hypothetical protein
MRISDYSVQYCKADFNGGFKPTVTGVGIAAKNACFNRARLLHAIGHSAGNGGGQGLVILEQTT